MDATWSAGRRTVGDAFWRCACRSGGNPCLDLDRAAAHVDDAIQLAVAGVPIVPGVTLTRVTSAGLKAGGQHRSRTRLHDPLTVNRLAQDSLTATFLPGTGARCQREEGWDADKRRQLHAGDWCRVLTILRRIPSRARVSGYRLAHEEHRDDEGPRTCSGLWIRSISGRASTDLGGAIGQCGVPEHRPRRYRPAGRAQRVTEGF